MQQMKEDAARNRQQELRRSREVAQLRKEQRAKEKLISSLEIDKQKRDIVLRRKQEEVRACVWRCACDVWRDGSRKLCERACVFCARECVWVEGSSFSKRQVCVCACACVYARVCVCVPLLE